MSISHIKLFVSHASEDKADFVRPLVDVLKPHCSVWYDEFELVVGRSLLEQINSGLRSCDFGVVVLSKHFFGKKWTQAELDGLFALETANRKMILPVWKDVTEDDVKSFSPILAGRLASNSKDGVPKVVADLLRAIQVSNITSQLQNPLMLKIASVSQRLQEEENAARLSTCSEEGVRLVRESYEELIATLSDLIRQINVANPILALHFSKSPMEWGTEFFYLAGKGGFHVATGFRGLGGNYTTDVRLTVSLGRRRLFGMGQEVNEIRKIEFEPTFRLPKQVVWFPNGNKAKSLSTRELAEFLIQLLVEEIGRYSK